MSLDYHQYGPGKLSHDPRAVMGKHARAAFSKVKVAPARLMRMTAKARECAQPFFANFSVFSSPSVSLDGLPCAIPPGANLTGGGLDNRSQSLSFKPLDHLSHKLSGGFPSHSQVTPSLGASQ
jgi:hypothetical protein